MTITEFGREFRAHSLTSEEATERCLANIRSRNAELNAFILVMADEARAQARQADRDRSEGLDHGPLHGVPISVKDIIDIRGTRTTAASAVRASAPAAIADAPVVAYLRAAGAVFVGKTNLHEFALGTTSEDSAFGAVKNPLDTSRSAGGSSGGSAASIVSGMALASVGTDTGGSIRIPSSACGIVGLKPSYGEVPTDGVIPLSPRLDHVGPLAQSVADAWTLFRVLMGDSRPAPLQGTAPAGIRLKVLRPYFCDLLDDEVRQRFEEALDAFRHAGMEINDAAIRHADTTSPVYLKIAPREAFLYHSRTLDAHPEQYTSPVRQRIELGRTISDEEFRRGLDGQAVLRDEVSAALADCDALVLPTMPIAAPMRGAEMVRVGATEQATRSMTLRETQLFNLTGHPAMSLPCGTTTGGLPIGLQLVGALGQTDALVRVALACEALIRRH